jgi:hypothetical protein
MSKGAEKVLPKLQTISAYSMFFIPITVDVKTPALTPFPQAPPPMLSYRFNPIISITPSKPSMSSWSIFTLLNFKIYYLSIVNYDLKATDLISIRATIYLGMGGWEGEAGRYGKGGGPVRGMWAGGGTGGGQVWAYPICCMDSCINCTVNPHQNDQGRKGPCFFERLIALKCLKCKKI